MLIQRVVVQLQPCYRIRPRPAHPVAPKVIPQILEEERKDIQYTNL